MEPEEEPELRKALADNENIQKIFALPATADSPVVVHYDHKMAGEAATNPKQRVPPFKDWHQSKCLRSWMAHRGGAEPADSLHEADEYVVFDGGKPGLYKELTKIFKEKTHDVRPATVMYKRDDIQARREKTRQGSVNQIETKLHITATITDGPVRLGHHYGSSSDGNAIGPIRLPAWGAPEVLMLTPAEKAKLFGKRRWDNGGLGRLEVQDLQPKKKVKWADNTADSEPAFLHAPCIEYYEDELALSGAVAVVDFTAGPGYFLWACVMRGVPSVGICISPMHLDVAFAHMVGLCLAAMCKEGHDLYDARMCQVLGSHGDTAEKARKAAAAAKAAAPRPTGNGRGKGRGRGRRGRGGQPDEADGGAGEDDGEEEPADGEEGGVLDAAEAGGGAAGSGSGAAGSQSGSPSGATTAEQRLMAKLAAMQSPPV